MAVTDGEVLLPPLESNLATNSAVTSNGNGGGHWVVWGAVITSIALLVIGIFVWRRRGRRRADSQMDGLWLSASLENGETLQDTIFLKSGSGGYYVDTQPFGQGIDSVVRRATQRQTGRECAVKTVPNQSMSIYHKEEIHILNSLAHPNVISLHEHFSDGRNTYIIMELCAGGELYQHIYTMGCIQEPGAAPIMRQILSALEYIHGQRVVHRDLKPENILLSACTDFPISVKLADFSLSKRFKIGQVLITKTGSPFYVAPEVLKGRYNHLCDLWSAGVVMYVMLSGSPPFIGRSDEETFRLVEEAELSFSGSTWNDVSPNAQEFIRSLVERNVATRFSAERSMQQSWCVRSEP